MSTYVGKIRFFVHKLDGEDFEILESDCFHDCLISDVSSNQDKEFISEYSWIYEEDIKDVLKEYSEDDVVEMLGDVHIEFTECPYSGEHDVTGWLGGVKHRKLDNYQMERFCNLKDNEIHDGEQL